jgi:hypothetical protein
MDDKKVVWLSMGIAITSLVLVVLIGGGVIAAGRETAQANRPSAEWQPGAENNVFPGEDPALPPSGGEGHQPEESMPQEPMPEEMRHEESMLQEPMPQEPPPEEPVREPPPPEEPLQEPPPEPPPQEPPPEPPPPQEPPPEPPPPQEPPPHEVVIDFWTDNDHINSGDCTILRWDVEHAKEVYLDGQGIVGHGWKEVCPKATHTYVLHVIHDGGTTDRQVTIHVAGGGSVPPPQSGGQKADLAVTDLYPDKQPKGKLWLRVTNHGPDTLSNGGIQLSCTGTATDYFTGAKSQVKAPAWLTVLNAAPGQTQNFETSLTLETNKFWYEITCTVAATGANDAKPSNDSYTETIPPPP